MDGDVFSGLRQPPEPDIAGSAQRIGAYVWTTSRLFEIAGHWAVMSDDADDKRRLAEASSRLAWQAAEWRRRLPRLREVDPDRLIRPPVEETAEQLDRLAGSPPASPVDALTGFLDGLARVYAAHAASASVVTDGPVIRSLERTGTDLAQTIANLSGVRIAPPFDSNPKGGAS